jgi:protocatechuate 3,4-dioxygenase beta subunit
MRCCTALIVLLVASQGGSAQQAVEKARIEGQVTNPAGEPLKKAAVRLQSMFSAPATSAPGTPAAMPTSYTSESDAAGNFVFEEIEPGRYTLSAERAGYIRSSYGARTSGSPALPIVLSTGQKLTGISFKLTPQSVISGRITDEDGDPVGRAQIILYQSRYMNGKRTLVQSGFASAGVDGTYQAPGLTGGRYYLGASDLQSMNSGENDLPGHKGPQEIYVTTYYPNGTDLSRATPIEVSSGSEVRGIEIRLQKSRVFRIHGKVMTGGPVPSAALTLVSQDAADLTQFYLPRGTTMVRADGTFDFQRVQPGTYLIRSQVVRTTGDTEPPRQLYSRQVVTVGDANIDNLEVSLLPGGELSGKITIEGRDQRQQPAGHPSVGLMPLQQGVGVIAANAQSNDDSTFLIKNIAPDRYRVIVNGLPPGTYVKAIRYGGQDVTKTALEGGAGVGGQLEVVLSPDAADVNGVVHNSKGDVMAGVTVTIWEPESPNTLPEANLFRTGVTDQYGNFMFRNLPPGDYRMAAWEQNDAYLQDPAFRAKFESQAITVKLTASGHGNTDLTAIPADSIESEAAKLR